MITTGPDTTALDRAAQAVHNAEQAYRAHLRRCAYYESEAGTCINCDTGEALYQATLNRAEEHRHAAETPAPRPGFITLTGLIVPACDADAAHIRRTDFANEHPERFTDRDRQQIAAGKCAEMTAFGMPWVEYCQADPAGASLYCAEHHTQNAELHGPRAFGLTL